MTSLERLATVTGPVMGNLTAGDYTLIGVATLASIGAICYFARPDKKIVAQKFGVEPVISEPEQSSYFPTNIAGIKTKIGDEYRPAEVVVTVEDLVKYASNSYAGVLHDDSGKMPFLIDLDNVCPNDWSENAQALLLLRNSKRNKSPLLLQGFYGSDYDFFIVDRLAGDVAGHHYNLGVGEDEE